MNEGNLFSNAATLVVGGLQHAIHRNARAVDKVEGSPMFSAWRYEDGLDEWMQRKLGPRLSQLARPVVVTVMDIVSAPIELTQRLFYRPNAKRDRHVVEDLHAKSRDMLNKTYLDACTQTFYADKKVGQQLNPNRTYENLAACTSGTFKAIGANHPQMESASFPGGPSVTEHRAPNSISIARMSDSQIISGRPRHLLVRPFKGELAANEFGATASGTFLPLAGFQKWQQENAPNRTKNQASKTGNFPSMEPDKNPHGLRQFMSTDG